MLGAASFAATHICAALFALLARFLGDHTSTASQLEVTEHYNDLVMQQMPPLRQAAHDRSEYNPLSAEYDREELCRTNPDKWCTCDRLRYNRVDGSPKPFCMGKAAKPVKQIAWLELALCVAIDAGGAASYFKPVIGEAYDLLYAFVCSFAIQLLLLASCRGLRLLGGAAAVHRFRAHRQDRVGALRHWRARASRPVGRGR